MASAEKELGQAIQFVQQKNYDAGAMSLNAVLKRPDLSNQHRAVGYVWLAETQDDINFKIQCLSQAQEFDPQNPTIRARLDYWLARQPRQAPYPTMGPSQQQQPPPPQPQQNTNANPYLPDSTMLNLPPTSQGDTNEYPSTRPQQQDDRFRTTGSANVLEGNQRSRIFNRISPPSQTGGTEQVPTVYSNINQPPPGGTPPQGQPPFDNFTPPNRQTSQQRSVQPHRLNQMYRVVGIKHGPNGNGSGVFVTRDGIIATTRHVVGGSQQVMVEIDTNYETTGDVIRSYPEIDLALVHVNVELERVWPPTNVPVIMDGESFVSVSYGQDVIRGNHRKSGGNLQSNWITTTVRLEYIREAGGDAMYDGNNYLLGILTRNASRETGYVYGLHILSIYEKVNEFLRERQQLPNSSYCHHCGHLTRAKFYGGYYCESCGALLPGMDKIDRSNRSSSQLIQVYNENISRTCPQCTARVGYYNSRCLRCGYDLEGRH